jgi:CRP-like cAMP-binding protein
MSDSTGKKAGSDIARLAAAFELDRLLPADTLARCAIREFTEGEAIVREGGDARHLLFFVEGRAKVYRHLALGRSALVALYEPLSVLGDLEFARFDRYRFDVVASRPSKALALPYACIASSPERHARLILRLARGLASKLDGFNARAAAGMRHPVEARLAAFLVAHAEGPRSGDGGFRLSLGEIADLIGASYRQLGRVVAAFRGKGLVSAARGSIEALDLSALKRLSLDPFPYRETQEW